MSQKKNETAEASAVLGENAVAETAAEPIAKKTAKSNTAVKPANAPDGFCVYLGPSIRGVIESGAICPGSLTDAADYFKEAIGKYPSVKSLIVTDKTLAVDRIKVKTAGNLLNIIYSRLASGRTR